MRRWSNICSHVGINVIMSEVLKIVKGLSTRRSTGLDDLNSESLKYSDPVLCLLLSFCHTCMFKHSYMPQSVVNSIIVLLVKLKCCNLTDENNYRLKSLSSIRPKVYEDSIVLNSNEMHF